MNDRYEALSAFLDRFGWFDDSHLHSVHFESTLDHRVAVALTFRAGDQQAGLADRTVRLVLEGVTEFHFAQAVNWMRFETSAGVAIGREGQRLFLDLGGPEWRKVEDIPVDMVPSLPPRHLTAEEIRARGCYFDFTHVTMDVADAKSA